MFIFTEGEWTPSAEQQMLSLVNMGSIKKVYYFPIQFQFQRWDYMFSPEDVMTHLPLLAITTGTVELRNMTLSSTQWQEIANNFGKNKNWFVLVGRNVDNKIVDFVAKICSKVKNVSLENVVFEDIDRFVGSFEKHLVEGKGNCEGLTLRNNEEETLKKYKEKIRKLGERLGWKITAYSWEDYIFINKET